MHNISYFPGQKQSEIIEFVVRKHWIVYVKKIVYMVLLMLLPGTIYFFLVFDTNINANTKNILTLFLLLYFLFLFMMTFIRWIEDDLDLIIVTNERLISIDQISFIHRSISETEMSEIQDVKHEAKGILSNVMGFGTLEVQTAAEKMAFCMDHIPEPYETARKIMELKDKDAKIKP